MIGIYQIKNIKNNKVYIGQSINIQKRWKQHINQLNKGKHCNSHLQYSWNKNGQDSFEFTVVETFKNVSKLDNRELHWIVINKSNEAKYGYNLTDDKGLGFKSKNALMSEKYIFVNKDKVDTELYQSFNKNEKLSLFTLRDFIQEPDNCVMINDEVPTIEELMKLVGLSKGVLISSLKSLEEKSMIIRKFVGRRKFIYINPDYYCTNNVSDYTKDLFIGE